MNFVRMAIQADPAQCRKLQDLQAKFAEACNAIAPTVRRTRCWNRVALHHMTYKELRERFPELGSQMACNAIYSVCRACRHIYQEPSSPFHVGKLGDRPLPLLRFSPTAPVYFDRHTLSIRHGEASLFTLDGRMRFKLDLTPTQERRFRDERLREVVLTREPAGFFLNFTFAPADAGEHAAPARRAGEAPEYVVVLDEPARAEQTRAATPTRVPAP